MSSAAVAEGAPRGPLKLLGFRALKEGMMGALRAPAVALAYGEELLSRFRSNLKDEVWSVYETVYLAALVLKEFSISERCYKALSAHWGSSSRRLRGLLLLRKEAEGRPLAALQQLKRHLSTYPGDLAARRRVVVVYKQQGLYKNCVEFLIAHLDENAGDKEAWHELAEVYRQLGLLQHAAFVWEELLMRDLHNIYYLLSYGELQCSIKQPALAIGYFSRVLLLDASNLRALWDLLLACHDLCLLPSSRPSVSFLFLGIEAAARLHAVYEAQQQKGGDNLFAAAARAQIAAISQVLKDSSTKHAAAGSSSSKNSGSGRGSSNSSKINCTTSGLFQD